MLDQSTTVDLDANGPCVIGLTVNQQSANQAGVKRPITTRPGPCTGYQSFSQVCKSSSNQNRLKMAYSQQSANQESSGTTDYGVGWNPDEKFNRIKK